MSEITLAVRPPKPEDVHVIARKLIAHAEAALERSVTPEPFAVFAEETGAVIGAVIGKIYLNWLHIDLVWIEEPYRRKGTGSCLMRAAEAEARRRGLSGIEVWSQDWQGPAFYLKLGYNAFATLDDFIPGGKRHAFRLLLE